MSEYLTPDFLARFTAKDMSRVKITTPWSQDGFTYATNGHIIIRVPGVVEFDADIDRPDAAHRLAPFAEAYTSTDGWYPMDRIDNPPKTGACEACKSTGKDADECADCDGSGEAECCECGQEIDCKSCAGTGLLFLDRECVYCKGAKQVTLYDREIVTPCGVFDGKYLALIASLPDAAIYVPQAYVPLEAAAFRFAGGVGALMPIRTDEHCEAIEAHAQAIKSMIGCTA